MDKAKLRKLLIEITEDCKNKDGYCFLREFFIHMAQNKNPRTIIQIKCVEKYKDERSKEIKKDLGWDEAWKEWTSDNTGYAKKFAEVYDEEKTFSQIYKEIRNSETKEKR